MSDRHELATVISSSLDKMFGARDFGPASQDYKLADELIAAGYVRAQPAWAETLVNDGAYEYTITSDCDGSNVKHWRRVPGLTYEGQASPWTIYTPEVAA